jgi:hypothetical protein
MRFLRTATGALAAVACVLAIAACAGHGATSGPPTVPDRTGTAARTAAGGVTACGTPQLRIALTNTGALGGQAGGYLRFTNDTRATCSLTGWPVVAGVTASGKTTTFRHARSTMFGAWQYSAPLPVVTLRPGNSAYAVVAADSQPAGTQTRCPAPDISLRVAAPDTSSPVPVSAWLPGAVSYLPTCTSLNGSPTGETSAITTLSKLPH